MFLDDEHFSDGPRPTEPPRIPKSQEVVLRRAFLIVSFSLLVLPVSADGVVDLVRYLFG